MQILGKPLTIVIKNFYRNKMVNLTSLSIKHFLPDVDIYCYTLYKQSMDEYNNQEPLHSFITEFTGPTKYVSGKDIHDHEDASKTSGYAHPHNGVFFTEGYNLMFEKFSDLDTKLLMLSEDHYFTTGETLKELIESDWDVAYADGDSKDASKANGSILGLIPSKVKHLFPTPETFGVPVEYLIGGNILSKISPNKLHRLSTRNWIDYKGDGSYTNSSSIIEAHMRKAGIL